MVTNLVVMKMSEQIFGFPSIKQIQQYCKKRGLSKSPAELIPIVIQFKEKKRIELMKKAQKAIQCLMAEKYAEAQIGFMNCVASLETDPSFQPNDF